MDTKRTIENAYDRTIADVKSYLNISQAAACNLVKRMDFPVCRIGSSIRVPADAFERWVKLHTSMPRALAESAAI